MGPGQLALATWGHVGGASTTVSRNREALTFYIFASCLSVKIPKVKYKRPIISDKTIDLGMGLHTLGRSLYHEGHQQI